MTIGHLTLELYMRAVAKYGLICFAAAYMGDACHVKKNVEATVRFAKGYRVSVDSYNPRHLEIDSEVRGTNGVRAIFSTYVQDGVEYGIGRNGLPRAPLDLILEDPQMRWRYEQSVRDKLNTMSAEEVLNNLSEETRGAIYRNLVEYHERTGTFKGGSAEDDNGAKGEEKERSKKSFLERLFG